MWIFTETGFVSAVEHRDDPSQLVVRARNRGSLEALQLVMSELTGIEPDIQATPNADYPYRIYADRLAFARWTAYMARDISYTNFKGQCYNTLPPAFSDALHDVWAAMHQVEDRDARSTGQEEGQLLRFPDLRSALE